MAPAEVMAQQVRQVVRVRQAGQLVVRREEEWVQQAASVGTRVEAVSAQPQVVRARQVVQWEQVW